MIDYKKELNDEQYVVVAEGDGPVLVLAGAGSGKTRTLVYRVAFLIDRNVPAERILLLTFTNKASQEMMSRVSELTSSEAGRGASAPAGGRAKQAGGLWGGTFHSVAHRILRQSGSVLGLKPSFTILDREDSSSLLKRVLKDHSSRERRLPQPGVVMDVISFSVNASIPFGEALERKYPDLVEIEPILKTVAAGYQESKKRANAVDFDDLLVLWLRLVQDPQYGPVLRKKWDYILVDEYQDTNTVQDAIVRSLGQDHRNILVVGDDAQSIYSFRAADIGNILSFPKHFPEARIFKLEQNYRSTPEILDLANFVIEKNENQYKKNLYTTVEGFIKPEIMVAQDADDEAGLIVDRILALEDEGVPLNQMAVLFRAAHVSQPLELELNRRRIPYEMRGGLKFFERAHIKDAISFLRLLVNISDEAAWYRALNLFEGIGDVTARSIMEKARVMPDWQAIATANFGLREAAQKGYRNFITLMLRLVAEKEANPSDVVRQVVPYYKVYAELTYTDFRDRLEDIEQLALYADRFDSIEEFLSETALQEAFAVRAGKEKHTEDGIILSTIHQAKGLEWQTVFLMQVTAASLPHPRALGEPGGLEEERRLFYVAITRARRRLYISYPLSGSRHQIALQQPSQFLHEIDPRLVTGLEATHEDEYSDEDDGEGKSYLPSIDRL